MVRESLLSVAVLAFESKIDNKGTDLRGSDCLAEIQRDAWRPGSGRIPWVIGKESTATGSSDCNDHHHPSCLASSDPFIRGAFNYYARPGGRDFNRGFDALMSGSAALPNPNERTGLQVQDLARSRAGMLRRPLHTRLLPLE